MKTIDRFAEWIVRERRHIERIFLLLAVVCAICFPFVGVNYDLSDYLPEFAPTKQALDVMEAQFGYPGMARIMLKNTTEYEAKQIRDKISDVDGVDLVAGVDLLTNVYTGDGFIESNKMTEDFYKDGNAVFQIIFEKGDSDDKTHAALNEIYEIVGKDRGCFSGSAVSSQFRQESITREIFFAMLLAIVIILAILLLTTKSWFEPFLFISVMIIAIILNMGSNLMFGSISFFTFSTAAILQLAVSMDYSIFLLHTFTAYEDQGLPVERAMVCAIQESSKSILASGATTIVGFLAIALMQFTIGKDVGFVLTKGILCSLAAVLLLMPALILRYNDRIKKSTHKSLMPSFDHFGTAMQKIRWPVLIICLLCAVPCYFGQGLNKFYYGDDALGASPGTKYYEDTQKINKVFGKSNMILAIVPNTSTVREKELTDALEDLDFVNYALSLSGTLPAGIPEDFLPADVTKQLHTRDYARIIISLNTVEESDYAFDCSNKMTEVVNEYYPENAYVIGMTPTTIDIRDILTEDYNRVSIISLIGVAIVVALTFQSILIPIFVIIPIEVAIYLNMTIPYLVGHSLIYIGYIIVSCLQLGATIDYSILVTNNYLNERTRVDRIQAAKNTISRSALSVLTSGLILTVVGYLLHFSSSIVAIEQVGHLVGRGALLSMLLVLSLLPALLAAFDKPILAQQQKSAARRAKHMQRLSARKANGKPPKLSLPHKQSNEFAPETPDELSDEPPAQEGEHDYATK